jgi:ferredoxin-NADP reductase
VRLLSNEPATPTTRVIRVALDGSPFPYRPGQAASIAVDDSGEPTHYSIASAPSETSEHEWLEFLVKVDGSTRFGAQVTTLGPGTPLLVRGPMGNFTLPDESNATRLLFIAGGTGIAPLRSMIMEAIHLQRSERLALVYSARSPEEFAYRDELRRLAAQGQLALTLTLTGKAEEWSYARGRAGTGHLADIATPDTVCFICGPPAMVRDLPDALTSLQVPRNRIRTEDW